MRPAAAETDEELWHAALAGDAESFADVYRRHADTIYRFCLHRAARPADADDVTSLTFLEAWRLRDRANFVGGSLLPWLLAIALNVARNHRRASHRHATWLARLPLPEPEPDVAVDVVHQLNRVEIQQKLAVCIAQLRPAEQDVITLCDLGGVDYGTAAQLLDIPLGTLKSRLSRARRNLQASAAIALANQLDDGPSRTLRPSRGPAERCMP
ncbi:MAG TPA: RNA polymerase sigma factor [Jatrophihabitantaceae bacterium]|nr:RNA polymerase sigma factor [Jatrophihabitantaceae bacterium]